jgi:hypothetical protein
MFFVLKFELILIIGSNKVLTEGARKIYRGRRVGQGCSRQSTRDGDEVVSLACQLPLIPQEVSWYSNRDYVNPRDIMKLQGLGQSKNSVTSSGNEPDTCWLAT